MTQVFTPNNDAGYCAKCQRGYAIGPHVCPKDLTQQFDMMPRELVSDQVLEHIDAQLPKVRDVRAPRLPDVLHVEHLDAESTARGEIDLTMKQTQKG
jgi:hypothetical protein